MTAPSGARLQPPTLQQIRDAQLRIRPYVYRTPLVELAIGLPDRRIYLKLETLQPIGAFKLRPAVNAILTRDASALRQGVAIASSGNMAYGMAWAARAAGIPMAAYMVADAPQAKIDGVRRLGGEVRFVNAETWWDYITEVQQPAHAELMINPVTDPAVLAGNGTIGLEIFEDLPSVDCIFTPFGGGSLTTGVSTAIKALRPQTRVYAVEGEHATPVTAALAAGRIVPVDTRNSFVKSIGGPSVVPGLWPLARQVIDGACVVRLDQVTEAMRMLYAHTKVVAEGAGAASLAAALVDPRATGNVVCVISGGNIDMGMYADILNGGIPPG